MSAIKYVCFTSLVISSGYLLVNLIKGYYKNKVKNLFIDIWLAYFLALLIPIALIWEFIDRKKIKSFKNKR